MGLFGGGNRKRCSVALIDIDSVSVGGALAHYDGQKPPAIHYTTRKQIVQRPDEEPLAAMLRSLDESARELIHKGGPALRRAAGSGHLHRVIVRIGAPLQQTIIRRERVEDPKSFIFTRTLVRDIVRRGTQLPDTYESSEETLVATLLNGYDTPDPYGKHAKFAELIILSSYLEKTVATGVRKVLRSVYHTHALTITAFASAAYSVFRRLFPHEKNFLVLKITGEATELIFIKGGTLVKVSSLMQGINTILRQAHSGVTQGDAGDGQLAGNPLDPAQNLRFSQSVEAAQAAWLKNMEALLREFAAEQALPRTIFLVTSDDARDYFTRLLDDTSLKSLWLSDEPLRVIGISSTTLASFITNGAEAEPDVFLALMALYAVDEDS
jgi:hypothetical protein